MTQEKAKTVMMQQKEKIEAHKVRARHGIIKRYKLKDFHDGFNF